MGDPTRAAARVAAGSAGMILFAFFAHQGMPSRAIAAGGLLLTAAAIALGAQEVRDRRSGASQREIFGVGRLSLPAFLFTLAGLGIGAGAGLWHRNGLDLPLLPHAAIEPFVLAACLIGAAEELVYRGWLLGVARRFGWTAAVLVAAVAHAAYKTALFAWPPVPVSLDLFSLFWLTATAGVVLGALRAATGRVWPAVAAHVAFDFVVYRAVAEAPWWVWG